jgi:hypothetical protein
VRHLSLPSTSTMKKKLNIVLLLLVLGLWGTVLYKYASQYFTNNDELASNKNEFTLVDLKIKEKDTFQINQLNLIQKRISV